MYLLLVLIGWLNIYAAVYTQDHSGIFDMTQNHGKQLIWIATSIFLAMLILIIDAKFFSAFSFVIYMWWAGFKKMKILSNTSRFRKKE